MVLSGNVVVPQNELDAMSRVAIQYRSRRILCVRFDNRNARREESHLKRERGQGASEMVRVLVIHM